MVVWKSVLKKPVYGPKCLVFEWSAKARDFTIWIPVTHTVQNSDESDIRVFGIQMVTVVVLHNLWTVLMNVLACSVAYFELVQFYVVQVFGEQPILVQFCCH